MIDYEPVNLLFITFVYSGETAANGVVERIVFTANYGEKTNNY